MLAMSHHVGIRYHPYDPPNGEDAERVLFLFQPPALHEQGALRYRPVMTCGWHWLLMVVVAFVGRDSWPESKTLPLKLFSDLNDNPFDGGTIGCRQFILARSLSVAGV
ncbi:MAG: hypothetical protein C7B46_20465 [Sulfobacillus benefaciens]|uniref:Uncharacterized protein n=1 Tax=Sulfobacillus benefaciens TaxID=453960 RepID=A0A2T2WUI2_9FIRM|nr:MAG: hypothetical protein C7B46_20465 [Sulfobacillus benefaciens]